MLIACARPLDYTLYYKFSLDFLKTNNAPLLKDKISTAQVGHRRREEYAEFQLVRTILVKHGSHYHTKLSFQQQKGIQDTGHQEGRDLQSNFPVMTSYLPSSENKKKEE